MEWFLLESNKGSQVFYKKGEIAVQIEKVGKRKLWY